MSIHNWVTNFFTPEVPSQVDPLNVTPNLVDQLAKFCCAMTYDVGVCWVKNRSAAPAPWVDGVDGPKETRPFPSRVNTPYLTAEVQTIRTHVYGNDRKHWAHRVRLSKSLKVIEGVTIRPGRDFLLMIHIYHSSFYAPISCCFRDKSQY